MYMYSNVLLFQFLVFFLLVIREVPSLILAQTQVSAPLNSRPVVGYRKVGHPHTESSLVFRFRYVPRGFARGLCMPFLTSEFFGACSIMT